MDDKVLGIDEEDYNKIANNFSARFVSVFTLYCLYFIFFTDISLKFWWILYYFTGIFVESILFAMPYTVILLKSLKIIPPKDWIALMLIYPLKWIFYILMFFTSKILLSWFV